MLEQAFLVRTLDVRKGDRVLELCLGSGVNAISAARRGAARVIGVDSLAFVSIDGLYRAMGTAGRNPDAPQFCDACFSGDYPIPLADADDGKVSVQLSLLADTA